MAVIPGVYGRDIEYKTKTVPSEDTNTWRNMDIATKDTQEFLLKAGKPVLLVGPHGVGKTSILRSIATNFNMKMHELNAATLDPFVHIVGIPVTADGKVTMNPPDALYAAEILFIDEVNRADRPTRNALFELICDKSVNGKKLPNLKLIVAAMNPPDADYHVDELDKAMDDRFLYRFDVKADITIALSRLKDQASKQIMQTWYEALAEPPSPRRLTWTIESAFNEDGSVNEPALLNALDDSLYGTKTLISMLTKGAAGPVAMVKDELLSEREKQVISNIIGLGLVSPQWTDLDPIKKMNVKHAIRGMFVDEDGTTFLPKPDGKMTKEDLDLFESCSALKEVNDQFDFQFSQRTTTDWSTWATDNTWLGKVV